MGRYTDKQAVLAAWGLGLYWGNHQVQDRLGQLISHVAVSHLRQIINSAQGRIG